MFKMLSFFSSKKGNFFDFAATSWLRQQLEMILQRLIKYIPGKKKDHEEVIVNMNFALLLY